MELWFSEVQTPHVKFSVRVDRQLYSGKVNSNGLMCLSRRSSAECLCWMVTLC